MHFLHRISDIVYNLTLDLLVLNIQHKNVFYINKVKANIYKYCLYIHQLE